MSYQLHCPNCNTIIPPQNINVQEMVAVCPECGAAFNFSDYVKTVQQKTKRRKSKKPDHINQIQENDEVVLDMPLVQSLSYRLAMCVVPLFMSILYVVIMIDSFATNDIEAVAVVSTVFLPIILGFLSSLFMRQAISINSEELKHEVRLGVPIYRRSRAIDEITDVSIEETTVTRESVASARYNLYMDTYDGRQDMFMQNLTEDTATYTQQVLSNYLHEDDVDSVNRLELQDDDEMDVMLIDEDVQSLSDKH